MDLRVYYQRIRDTREKLTGDFYVVVSCETPDGGKAGICNEVSKELAAKMLVDGTATLANEDLATEFRSRQAAAKEKADRELAASKIPLTILSTDELNRLRAGQD